MFTINYHFQPIDSEDDPFIVGLAKQSERLLHEMEPGTRLVEFFTWMRYIPSRFTKWKQDAEYWFAQDSLMFGGHLGKVANDLFPHRANGVDRPSFGASVIQNQSKHDLSECEQAWLYPEVQTRAHAELDEVVGNARPPMFDLASLPYIHAMVKEALHWLPSVPFGIPHASTEDDWYEGMFIPKGTLCFQNMRTLNFDPEVFGSNAMDFDPARYLDKKGQVKALMLLWAMRFEHPEGARGELDVRTVVHAGITAKKDSESARKKQDTPETHSSCNYEPLQL
ncbi:cytochrome P450 [Lactarius sanguifluus]|nr:cytochrome P450 [Lactarius sanguifluus]